MAYNNVKVKARQTVAQANTQTKDLGTVSEVPMGEWNATTQYKKLNTVRSHNATYIAKRDNEGVEPTVTQGWQEIWQGVAYDGGIVSPDGNYPQMSVGQATNDGDGNNIAQSFQSLREDIQNECHFRGYLATNAEIKALSGTPNDYAYSAESGTVWIYQTATGWSDSGKPVPDQTTPASNTLPLPNGIANAGTSNAYSRGDHVHQENLLKSYPVGSIFISANSASPAMLFGGIWESIQDMFLLGASSNHSLGSTGGSADSIVVKHRHNHIFYADNIQELHWEGRILSAGNTADGVSIVTGNPMITSEIGEDGTGKNLPPYLSVNIWKRIA